MERRHALHALVQHRARARLHEAAHGVEVAERARPVQRRLAVGVEHVDLRVLVQQEGDALLVAQLGRQVQQRGAALGDAVDVDARLVQQRGQR